MKASRSGAYLKWKVTRYPDAALRYGGTLPDQFMDSHHLKYPPVAPKPFKRLKSLCE